MNASQMVKGDMVNRGCKKIQPIRYTPDFIDME